MNTRNVSSGYWEGVKASLETAFGKQWIHFRPKSFIPENGDVLKLFRNQLGPQPLVRIMVFKYVLAGVFNVHEKIRRVFSSSSWDSSIMIERMVRMTSWPYSILSWEWNRIAVRFLRLATFVLSDWLQGSVRFCCESARNHGSFFARHCF